MLEEESHKNSKPEALPLCSNTSSAAGAGRYHRVGRTAPLEPYSASDGALCPSTSVRHTSSLSRTAERSRQTTTTHFQLQHRLIRPLPLHQSCQIIQLVPGVLELGRGGFMLWTLDGVSLQRDGQKERERGTRHTKVAARGRCSRCCKDREA